MQKQQPITHVAAHKNDPYATPLHHWIDAGLLILSVLLFAAFFLHH